MRRKTMPRSDGGRKKREPANSPEARLRAILGVTGGEAMPRVGLYSLRRFHDYLAGHLGFPFKGRLMSPVGPHRDTASPLSVVGLMDPVEEYAPEEMYGLICKAVQNGERIELPLARIDVAEDGPNRQLLDDYHYWFSTFA